MSLPNFDPVVELHRAPSTTSVFAPSILPEFTVTGDIPTEQQSQNFAILVSIWQSEEDTAGGSAATIVGRALGVAEHRKDPGNSKWSVAMSVREGEFIGDKPATGVGLIVAANDDPTSFETYSWIARLQLMVVP